MEPVTRDVYTTIKVSDISNNLCYMSISKLTIHLIAYSPCKCTKSVCQPDCLSAHNCERATPVIVFHKNHGPYHLK